MSNPPVNPANGYGEAIGNGHQTVNLASAVLELVHQPLTSFWANRNARAALRKSLGEWAEEAFDTNDQCQQPILREDPFVTHLIDNKAAFHPSGTCSATFAWAKLLYALDIRPGNKIIEWRPLGTDADPYKSGTVELALEGPVLCHIVNLYQIYNCPYGVDLEGLHKYGATWRFPFGALTVRPEHNSREGNNALGMILEPRSWMATFKPHSNNELSASRRPFMTNFKEQLEWSGGPLPFEPNSVAINLCKCFEALRLKKPYLVTPSWIKQANRIKRRVTTNGGTDDGLAEDVVQLFSPAAVEEITQYLKPNPMFHGKVEWENHVQDVVRKLFFYQNDTFQFLWPVENVSGYTSHVDQIVIEELPSALKSLGESSPRTWLTSLSEMVPAVMEILHHREIKDYPVLVLQLSSDHPLWRSTFYIQGQVPTR
ncbi:hypothetical protein GGR55DRAFT_695130 [Xylaria sp. FL0064]|nr:hypothetical protein GGR55DRAFT_695130 [Xylaria sp. FL0064]